MAGQPPLADEGPWVVQVSYDGRAELEAILAINNPWHVDPLRQLVVLEADAEQLQHLQRLGVPVVVDQELSAQLNQLNQRLPNQTSGIPGDYYCYRTVEETLDTIQQLAASYPNLASWIDMGDSWEKTEPDGEAGYDLVVLHLTNSAVTDPKPALFVMSSVHAREYTPAELNTRFAEYLLDNYDQDADVTWLLDYTDIYLLLQANPDGRKKAETGLYWRKNTNNNYCSDSNSRGADLNRNFSFQWYGCGNEMCSSSDPCEIDFRGPEAASEPETQSIEAFLRTIFPDQRPDLITAAAPLTTTGVFVDLHSYGSQVLWPWGFTYTEAPNGDALQTLGRKMAYWNEYDPFQASSLYPTDGATDDFAYGELGIAAFTWELGTAFFQDCSTFEQTILPDNLAALLYTAKASHAPYLLPAGPEVSDITLSVTSVPAGDAVHLEAVVDDTHYQTSSGVEPVQTIAAAELTLDSPPWITTTVPLTIALEPADGVFDSTVESVVGTIDTGSLTPGRHTVFVRGRDAAGNWGAVSAAFLTVTEPLPDTTWTRTADSHPWAAGTVVLAEAGGMLQVTDVLSGTQSLVLTESWQPEALAVHSVQVDPIGDTLLISTTSALTLTVPITSTRPLTLTRVFELLPGEWDETIVQTDLVADDAWLAEKPFTIRKVIWHFLYLPVLLGS